MVKEDNLIVSFEFEPKYGYPRSFYTDIEGWEDAFESFAVTSFKVIAP